MSLDSLFLWGCLGIPSTRVALTVSTFVLYVLPPFLGYFFCAVLAVKPHTRSLRIASWPVVALLALRAGMSLDLSLGRPERKFLEIDLVLSMFSIACRTLDWTIAREPFVRHLRPAKATPSTLMDAFDLASNLRGYGWNWSRGLYVPRDTRPSKSRMAFVAYVFLSGIFHASLCGTLHVAVQSFSPAEFSSLTGGTIFDDTLPFMIWYLRATLISVIVAFAIYAVLHMGYDLCTIPGILVFGQDPAQWPPSFDAPWRATSLVDFWGCRWHQWFRHIFLFVGGYPLSFIFGRVGIVIGSFLASAVFHHIVLITLNGSVELWRMLLSFGMMAFGVLSERAFEQTTGKKVGGWAGWIWTMSWLIVWGNIMIDGWGRAGMFGSSTFLDSATPIRGLVEHLVMDFDAWLRTL